MKGEVADGGMTEATATMTTTRTLAETVAEGGQAKEDKGDQVKEEALQAEWAKTSASACKRRSTSLTILQECRDSKRTPVNQRPKSQHAGPIYAQAFIRRAAASSSP